MNKLDLVINGGSKIPYHIKIVI